jgi:hypothetical protein
MDPRAWRDRYGAEVVRLTEELIAAGETTPAQGALNLASAAVVERGRALADSRRAAVAMAVAALVAAAGSFYVTAHARPPGPATAASAQSAPPARPVPARMTRFACVIKQPAAARPLPVSSGRAEIKAGAAPSQSSLVLVPVRVVLPHRTAGDQCVMLPATCRPGLAKSPGATIKPGQCVVVAPELSRRALILPGW